MAVFDDLPNEIILETLRIALPEDLENFAQTSRRVFLLARLVLQHHRETIRRHSKFNSRLSHGRDQSWLGPLPCLLREIVHDPRIGRYVRKVQLKSLIKTSWAPWENELGRAQAVHNLEDDLVHAVTAQSNVPNLQTLYSVSEALSPSSDYGCSELLIALFLLCLPNLNTLSVHWDSTRGYFADMLRRSSLDGNCWLSNLTTVHVEEYFETAKCWLLDLSLFNSLPSLKSLTASKLYVGRVPAPEFWPPADSHTTELQLLNTNVTSYALKSYLSSFRCLHTFVFDFFFSGTVALKDRRFDPDWICASLLAHNKMMLHSLTIHGPIGQRRIIGSLQDFLTLREIRTEWELLFPEDCLETWPSQILPASLRQLRLRNNKNRKLKDYTALFRGVQIAREETCPNLELVVISTEWKKGGLSEESDHLHRFCTEMGMFLTLQKVGLTGKWNNLSVISLTFTEDPSTKVTPMCES